MVIRLPQGIPDGLEWHRERERQYPVNRQSR